MSIEVKEKVRDFLKKMELKFTEKENRYIIPCKIADTDFMVIVNTGDNWIFMGTILLKAKDLQDDLNKEEFYAQLLRETFYANEVTYGLTREGDVVVHAETSVRALTFENFRSEFGSVVAGAGHFVENIMKDYPKI